MIRLGSGSLAAWHHFVRHDHLPNTATPSLLTLTYFTTNDMKSAKEAEAADYEGV